MTESKYSPPVDRLLTYGDCQKMNEESPDWPDYVKELGLTKEDIPELIRMVQDDDLNWADQESLDIWAPTHAWRALGQLKAVEAVGPLLDFMQEAGNEDDWANQELAKVFSMIGAPAIPELSAFIADTSKPTEVRGWAADCLGAIGLAHPELRNKVVSILRKQLAHFEDNSDLNGMLVWGLLDLNAVEAASEIGMAYMLNKVDERMAGDWNEAQEALGLKKAEKSKPTPEELPPLPDISNHENMVDAYIQMFGRESMLRQMDEASGNISAKNNPGKKEQKAANKKKGKK
ncbi:MAG TPA: PBS lyase [Chloroflexia bacterium]|nr:PBS lyase [Chloroflexia bacterium]